MPTGRRSTLAWALGAVVAGLPIGPSQAADLDIFQAETRLLRDRTDDRSLLAQLKDQARRLDRQASLIAEQGRRLAEQQRALVELQAALAQAAQSKIRSVSQQPTPQPVKAAQPPAPTPRQQPPRKPAVQRTAQVDAARRPDVVRRARPKPGGVLLPKGRMVWEPSLEFIHSTVRKVEIAGFSVLPAITIGSIDIREVQRDTLVAALSARYGLGADWEIEGKVPYVWRDDSTTTRPIGASSTSDETSNVDGAGLGDIELAVRHQVNDGGGGVPFLVAGLRVKAPTGENPFNVARDPTTNLERELPTGTGFWTVEPNLSAILPTDPAVLFANLSYGWNIKRDVGNAFGTIDPGDSIGLGFGTALSLNRTSSISLGGDYQIVGKTTQRGQTVAGSSTLQVGKATLGYSYRLNDATSINFSMAAGITDDAPDAQFTLRIPTTVDLLER